MKTVVDNLIASNVYPLNKSRSKFAVVGLAHHHDDSWSPEIVLCGQIWRGVHLTLKEWSAVTHNAARLNAYFNGLPCDAEIPISQRCTLLAQDAYNMRAVTLKTTDGKFNIYFKILRN